MNSLSQQNLSHHQMTLIKDCLQPGEIIRWVGHDGTYARNTRSGNFRLVLLLLGYLSIVGGCSFPLWIWLGMIYFGLKDTNEYFNLSSYFQGLPLTLLVLGILFLLLVTLLMWPQFKKILFRLENLYAITNHGILYIQLRRSISGYLPGILIKYPGFEENDRAYILRITSCRPDGVQVQSNPDGCGSIELDRIKYQDVDKYGHLVDYSLPICFTEIPHAEKVAALACDVLRADHGDFAK